MQVQAFLLFSLSFLLAFPLLANSNRPVCVKVNEATALVSLVKPAPVPRKIAAKKSGLKKEVEKKDPPIRISKYTPLNWTGKREGRWIEIQTMLGQTYWVRRKDVSTSLRCLTVKVEQSRLHKGPGPTFEKGEVALRGDVFLDMGGEDGWTRIQDAYGMKAWINLDHVWKPESLIRMSFTHGK
jgi:hypothetical protein